MTKPLNFTIHSKLANARTGTVETLHGSFDTPAFMPVGTRATIKGILPNLVKETGSQILLNNTYHLMLRPGSDLIRDMGGVHKFMNWNAPILTDSGGYQAYSMADINSIDEDGVSFKSILDGSKVRMNPEIAMQVQNELGPDIMMAFDDCPPSVDPKAGPVNQTRLRHATQRDTKKKSEYNHHERLILANERTVRWLERCKASHARPSEQSLFGIVQGGTDLEQRDWSVERICNIDLPGYAIGGVAVGESPEDIARIVQHTAPQMPEHKPRYLMGVGYERDIVSAVLSGVDMFDCVMPTRHARNAQVFTWHGRINLRWARLAEDDGPIDPTCGCLTCQRFSRAYLRHLERQGEALFARLATLHNLYFFHQWVAVLRRALRAGDFTDTAQALSSVITRYYLAQ